MSKIKAILVDDEESARDVLENLLLRFCPEIEIIAKCSNVLDAVEEIKKETPHVVFLDIEMPQYAGYEIIKFFEEINFDLIFITAYDQYAIRAFEVAALDYLLKPIDINRLKESIERLQKNVDKNSRSQQYQIAKNNLETKQLNNIVISQLNQQHIISINEIIAIEAHEAYCEIFTTNKSIIASKNLKYFERILEDELKFMRVHKSWLVNMSFIEHYSKSDLTIMLKNGIETKLSKYKKAEFEAILK